MKLDNSWDFFFFGEVPQILTFQCGWLLETTHACVYTDHICPFYFNSSQDFVWGISNNQLIAKCICFWSHHFYLEQWQTLQLILLLVFVYSFVYLFTYLFIYLLFNELKIH